LSANLFQLAKGIPKTKQQQVIEYFHKNPGCTSSEIADEFDCDSAYVRATLRRAGLRLNGSHVDPGRRRGLLALGRAAQRAGLTVDDIQKMGAA
jgi:DNA-directed RNA polymerase specialized sigma24 family protein